MRLVDIGKIFLLGDLHLGIRNNSIDWSSSQSSFLIDFFCKKIDELGFDPKRDILIQEGDWFHNREHTNNRIWNDSLRVFEALSKKFPRGIYIILGNHDVYYKDNNSIHSLKGIEKIFPNVHVFEKPEILTINEIHRFLMLPWIEDEAKITKEVLSNVELADYIICHADIKSFKLNKWVKLHSGLDIKLLNKFKRVWSGHIHIHQENGNVLYTGTPYELDRGDRGNAKGFHTLILPKTTTEDIKEIFTENTFSPRFIKVDAFELLEHTIQEIKDIFNNNYVDIMMPIDKAASFPVTRFMEIIDSYGHKHVEFFTYNSSTEVEINKLEEPGEIKEYDIYEIFTDCLEERNYPESINNVMKSYFKKLNDKVKNKEKDYE
tara:strand:- start:3627 stop:4757 length:1131 start_codon:yes stop_codon:yes gene_type:complete